MGHEPAFRKGSRAFLSVVLSALLAAMPFGAPAAHADAGHVAAPGAPGAPGALVALAASLLPQADAGYDVAWYCDDPDSQTYWIGNARQLRGLSELVNGTARYGGTEVEAVDFVGKRIVADRAIDLSGAGFTPIGTPEHPFSGTFDGAGKAIRGLSVSGRFTYAGLFGYASERSCLKDVALEAAGGEGVALQTDADYIANVGSLAGQVDGAVSGCTSDVPVKVDSSLASSEGVPYTVQRVGGLAGYARGDVSGCAYTGTLEVQIAADALNADTSSDSLRVADSFGGLIGRFGDPDRHGTLADSLNEGDVVVQTFGAGGQDRFGTGTNAVAFFVGGIAGYSNGSIVRCRNGAYDENTRIVTGKVFTGVYKDGDSAKGLLDNRGADEVGGICGSLRGNSDDPAKYNDGDPADPVAISDCYNEAQVTGLVATGGIVGQTGVYCTVTRCYNGTISDLSDWQRNQEAGKVVSTRWNKPFSAGIVGQTRSGTVSYCANYAEVRNIQTGYYMAGIAGCIFVSDDYPGTTGEIFSCFNSGGIYTINTAAGAEYREAGICGQNEGYIHDCIVMKGSVPYHGDSAIGANDWGAYANLYVKTPEELASAQSAALLNAIASQAQDWSCYWFVNREGYPVLNSWVSLSDADRIELSAANVASAEQLAPAPWVGPGAEAMPTLKVTLADGTELVQDTDFRVIPQPGAYEISTEPYLAGIEGIGLYCGTVERCARYYIATGDLANASVQVRSQKYRFGKVVFPESVDAYMKGSFISPDEYDYVVYGSQTSTSQVQEDDSSHLFAVYDSAGYLSFTVDGATKYPVSSDAVGGAAGINALDGDWWLWDREGRMISDSAGNSYYATGPTAGKVYGPATSCVNLKGGSPAGYAVKLTAHASSAVLSGSCVGQYVIEPVDLYRECTFEGAECGGQTWLWDADAASFYREEDGRRVEGAVSATFTGQTIEPACSLSYGEGEGAHQLAYGTDFRVVCGDPDPADAGAVAGGDPNRDVTGEGRARAAVTLLPVNTSNMSNYIIAYFDIAPARFEDCEVSIASDEWAYTGGDIRPDVSVTLGGVALREGVDFAVEYSGNVEKGTATYTVTPLANLSGGTVEPYVGEFTIGDGIDLSAYSLGEVADQQFNWGFDVHPALAVLDGDEAADIVEGVDYTVSYSTNKVTKWSDADKADARCTVTLTGIGRYTGSLSGEFDIVPYDAAANATGQLRAYVQDMAYGTWGLPASATATVNGAKVPRDALANVGTDYPVMAVVARPVVDWDAYRAAVARGADAAELEESGCYGDAIALTTANNNASGGLVARFPARYRDAQGNEVNGNGGVYTDASGGLIAQPAPAEPGAMTATVELRCGTSGARGGAAGVLDCGAFDYTAPADLSTVNWRVEGGTCTYDGTEKRPIAGTTKGSGARLAEGEDYEIEYSGDTVNAGVASYTVRAAGGEGARFAGSYAGTFSIMPCNLASAPDLRVEGVSRLYLLRDAAAGIAPEPDVYVGQEKLVYGRDYELGYANNHSPSDEAAVYVEGRGNYTGTVSVKFAIVSSLSLSDAAVTGVSGATYSGAAVKRIPVVKMDGTTLKAGTHYTVTYLRGSTETKDFTSAGTVTVRIAAKANSGFTGSKSVTYKIAQASLASAAVTLSATKLAYNGAARKPAVRSVKVGSRTLEAGADYTVAYLNASKKAVSSPKAAGTYYVKVTGKGNYLPTTSKALKYTIAKAGNALSVKAGSNPLKAKYGKATTIAASKAFKVAKNASKGKLTYKKTSGNAKISVSSAGKLTVKAGLKKGTYPVKARVTSAATANYTAKSVNVTLRVKVS